jgi:hypothetical protein
VDDFTPIDLLAPADGDLRWVFPEPGDVQDVLRALRAADGRLRAIARHLGRPGEGRLALERVEGIALAGIFGAVDLPGVHVSASVHVPRRCLWDSRQGPPWRVAADVLVECTAYGGDCGGHRITTEEDEFGTPGLAARALAEATDRLAATVLAEPAEHWRTLPAAELLPDAHR